MLVEETVGGLMKLVSLRERVLRNSPLFATQGLSVNGGAKAGEVG